MGLCNKDVTSSSQTLEAMRWYFGARQCRTITLVDDVSGALDGEYFELNIINNEYVEEKKVILLSNGTTTTIVGLPSTTELITVTFSDDDTANTIGGLIVTALDGYKVRTELVDAELEIQNQFVGIVTVEDYTNAASLTIEIGETGFGGYLGHTEPTEMSTATETVDLVDDATGTTIVDKIIVGQSIELPLGIKELTKDRWESLIGNVAGSTIEIDGKKIIGFGTGKLYQSLLKFSGRLVGHPVRLPVDNNDEDITILKTAPLMDSINFSGADVKIGSFTFVSYKDGSAPDAINLMALGDHTVF